MVIKIATTGLRTKFGHYTEHLYYNGQKETIALVMGDVNGATDVLCRVHSACLAGHVFNSIECDCMEQMEISQRLIQQTGRGIIIYMEQEGKGNGHFALLKSKEHKANGLKQSEAYIAAGFVADARDFSVAAEILSDLGVVSIVMLTNNAAKSETVAKHGIKVIGIKRLEI